MSLYRGYEPARGCTTGPTPGARALMSVFLGLYARQGGTNLGIYQCATIPGSMTVSLHGEGRATDLGVPPGRGRGAGGWGWPLARRLVGFSAELGIQLVIFDGRVWSGRYPDAGWRDYTGINPHEDHIHAELCRWAAQHFTQGHFSPYLDVTQAAVGTPPAPSKGKPMFVADVQIPGKAREFWWTDGLRRTPIRDGDDLDFFRTLSGRPDVVITTAEDFAGRTGGSV